MLKCFFNYGMYSKSKQMDDQPLWCIFITKWLFVVLSDIQVFKKKHSVPLQILKMERTIRPSSKYLHLILETLLHHPLIQLPITVQPSFPESSDQHFFFCCYLFCSSFCRSPICAKLSCRILFQFIWVHLYDYSRMKQSRQP